MGCNDNFAKIAGLKSANEIVGKSDYDLTLNRERAKSYMKDDKKVIESGKSLFHIVEHQKQRNGKHVWLDTNKIPMYNSSKEIVGILGTFTNITDRKNKEIEKDKIYSSIQT
ncbi:PAS domain-containing protein, partial [Ancylomarina longa]